MRIEDIYLTDGVENEFSETSINTTLRNDNSNTLYHCFFLLHLYTTNEALMEITEVRINFINEGRDNVRAFASITLDNCFVVRGLKIVEKDRFYINMPNRKRKDGTFSDIAFPIKNEMRREIEFKVLEKYEQEIKNNFSS